MPFQYTCTVCGIEFQRKWSRPTKTCSLACRDTRPTVVVLSNDGLSAQISIHRRDHSIVGYAVVDAADAEWLSVYKWHMGEGDYAQTSIKVDGKWKNRYMHQLILKLEPDGDVCGDHIDRDRLNNRRLNLRESTRITNPQNRTPRTGASSQYRGVSWRSDLSRWVAGVYSGKKRIHLGYFDREEDAAEAAKTARSIYMPYSTD